MRGSPSKPPPKDSKWRDRLGHFSTSLNPLDAFAHQKLPAKKHQPAPRANLLTLIRRVSYDMIGLPPTPTEVHQFINAANASKMTPSTRDFVPKVAILQKRPSK